MLLRPADRLVAHERHASHVRPCDREHQLADPAGGQRRVSAAMPPAGASTGRPAFSASVKVGADSGSTPTTVTAPAYHAADAAEQPAAADRHQHRVERRLLREFHAERSLPEQRLGLIERVNGQGPKSP